MAMVKQAPYYAQFGQMEGTILYLLLMDMKAEGWGDKALLLETEMCKRADHWHTLQYPFGSEMPWDSTGQEEVYTCSEYFGYTEKARVTTNAIMGYMPTVMHWGIQWVRPTVLGLFIRREAFAHRAAASPLRLRIKCNPPT
jgi:hypothetical protein